MKKSQLLVNLAIGSAAAVAVAAAVVLVQRGKKPSPENVVDLCLKAADELDQRLRNVTNALVAA